MRQCGLVVVRIVSGLPGPDVGSSHQASPGWIVYMIRASDHTLYTGITTDVARRFSEHANGKGAKYFHAGRQPEQLVYIEVCHDRSSASRREAAIKKLSRREKCLMIENAKERTCKRDRERGL